MQHLQTKEVDMLTLKSYKCNCLHLEAEIHSQVATFQRYQLMSHSGVTVYLNK